MVGEANQPNQSRPGAQVWPEPPHFPVLFPAADAAGDDWMGTDGAGKPWACTTGQQQSPINLVTAAPSTRALANEHRAKFELGAAVSNGSNVLLVNNGQGVRVSWTQPGFSPKVTITAKGGWARAAHACRPCADMTADEGQLPLVLTLALLCVPAADGQPAVSAAEIRSGDTVQQVAAVPQQFHFHAHSEHLLQGEQLFVHVCFDPLHPAGHLAE